MKRMQMAQYHALKAMAMKGKLSQDHPNFEVPALVTNPTS